MGVTYATIFPQVWRMEGLQMKHMYLEDLVTVSVAVVLIEPFLTRISRKVWVAWL